MTPALVETISAVATLLAVAGVVLNNLRLRWCFIIWLVSNGLTLAVHADSRLVGLAIRDGVFLMLAVHGWVVWSRSDKR